MWKHTEGADYAKKYIEQGKDSLPRSLKLPTMGANEFRGSAKDRFIGSKNFRGSKTSEGLRTCADDPIYLNPCFAELMMGFPQNWTNISGKSASKLWETRLCQRARKSREEG